METKENPKDKNLTLIDEVDKKTLSPYINTLLTTRVRIQPYQMDSDLYLHIKNNLRRQVASRCTEYGYVSRIFEIKSSKGGEIIQEDPSASVIYDVTYSCRFCRPVVNNKILCEISNI